MAPCDFFGEGAGGRVCTIFSVLLQGAWRKDVNGGEPLATANRKPLDSAVCGFATIKVIRELIHLAGQGWSQWFSSYSSLRSLSMSQSEIRGPRWLPTVAHRSCRVRRSRTCGVGGGTLKSCLSARRRSRAASLILP